MIELEEADFTPGVIERSFEMPVLVDFWADWCAPCKMLSPILETLDEAYQGRLQIAKVNTDEQRGLAESHGIRSLPTLRLYRNGEVVEEVLGAQSESALRDMIERHLVRAADTLLQNVRSLLDEGQQEAAVQLLEQGIQENPGEVSLVMALARLCLSGGALERADELLKTLPREHRDSADGKILGQLLEFARIAENAGPADQLMAALQDDPSNARAWHELGALQIVAGEYSAALDSFMELLKRDRRYSDNAAQRGLITLFDLLGEQDERVANYRRKMASLLL